MEIKRVWSLKPYQEGDERRILELWKAVYPGIKYEPEQWTRWWRWMYQENPAGKNKIWLAKHDDKIVGQSAIVPVMIKIGTEVVTGFQAIDTMTHPEYRRQGIYETLARTSYDQAANEDIHIGFRFPNKTSHLIAITKLGWFDVAPRQFWVKPINWKNVVKHQIKNRFLSRLLATCTFSILNKAFLRARKTPTVEGVTIGEVSSFDDRINEFWNKISNQYQIILVRDKNYLNWRYVTVPDITYCKYIAEKAGEIHGYSVLRCRQEGNIKLGVIFDILAQSQEIAHCLVSKAIQRFEYEKVDIVLCRMIANKTLCQAFRKNGFISIPFIKGGYFCAYSSSPRISQETLKDHRNWFVQLGDSDTL